MSSVAITNISMSAVASSFLALSIAPLALLTLPVALLGKGVADEFSYLLSETRETAIKAPECVPLDEYRSALCQSVESLWQKELQTIQSLRDQEARKNLQSEFEASYQRYQELAQIGDLSPIDTLFRALRMRVREALLEENIFQRLSEEFEAVCERLPAKDSETAQRYKQQIRTDQEQPFNEQFNQLIQYTAELKELVPSGQIEKNAISFDLPPINPDAEKIRILDEEIYQNEIVPLLQVLESPFTTRQEMVSRELKLRYHALRSQIGHRNAFKEEISPLLPLLEQCEHGNELIQEIEGALQNKKLKARAYTPLYERARTLIWKKEEQAREQLITQQVTQLLGKMGYSLLSDLPPSAAEQILYLKSPYSGYHVMLRVTEGSRLATRLVRFVTSQEERENSSSYQKQKDIEVGQSWCSDQEEFLKILEQQGIHIAPLLRKEPHEVELLLLLQEQANSASEEESANELVSARRVN